MKLPLIFVAFDTSGKGFVVRWGPGRKTPVPSFFELRLKALGTRVVAESPKLCEAVRVYGARPERMGPEPKRGRFEWRSSDRMTVDSFVGRRAEPAS